MTQRFWNPTARTAIVTVAVGVGLFLAVDVARPERRLLTFEASRRKLGAVEAINGALFPRTKGVFTITEPLAHVPVPFGRTLFGKTLTIRPRFHLDEADVLEVGVKKTAFWLDYDRLPLQHKILDDLEHRDERPWSVLRDGRRVAYVNPAQENPWKTLAEFEERPPTDGPIGLYGHATLACGRTENGERRTGTECLTRPFRLTDAPDDFRAIYAFYPKPDTSDPEWTENEQRFNLSGAYQNEDGSIDVMFFIQRQGNEDVRVLMDEIEFRVQPGWPRLRDLAQHARRNVVRLIKRPAHAR